MTLKIIMLNEKPNQNTHCMIPFNQIPENSIYIYRKGKKEREREVYVPGKEDGRRNELQREVRKVWGVELRKWLYFGSGNSFIVYICHRSYGRHS